MNAVDPTGLAYLVPIDCGNFYNSQAWGAGHLWLHESVADSFRGIVSDVEAKHGKVVISDMYRTWAEQADAHRRKPKWAVPAGKSYHQTGLAFDFSLADLGIPLQDFQDIVRDHGWETIRKENWHMQYDFKKLGYDTLSQAIGDVEFMPWTMILVRNNQNGKENPIPWTQELSSSPSRELSWEQPFLDPLSYWR